MALPWGEECPRVATFYRLVTFPCSHGCPGGECPQVATVHGFLSLPSVRYPPNPATLKAVAPSCDPMAIGLILGVRFSGERGRRRRTLTVNLSLYAQVLAWFDAGPGCVRSSGCG